MKSLISKLFQAPLQEKEQSPAVTYPQLAPFISLKDVKQRSIIGWIAYRLATLLELDKRKSEILFYLTFTTESFNEVEDEELKHILHLAQSAGDWLQKNAFVDEEIKKLHLSSFYNNVLSRVISEIQTEEHFDGTTIDKSDGVWEVYRDVIYAATHGQFLLIDKERIIDYKQGELLCQTEIKERKDIPRARELAQESFDKTALKRSKVMSYKLIISEAVTNVLKHAAFGMMQIYKDGDIVRVVIEDKGRGFPLKILPQTTLMAGFSTKNSLGQGFTLMMKMAEQVILETSSSGSTLILILDGERDDDIDKY